MYSVGRPRKFRDHPFPYHHELELEIHTLTNRGIGLGRVALPENIDSSGEDSDDLISSDGSALRSSAKPSEGWVIMVPSTLPGERVKARIFRNQKNYSEADLVEVLTPSPHRVDPRCSLFGLCGGCQYQHLSYSEQLVWKRQQVEELLEHMAGLTFPVAPVIGSPREFGYRSKITPHFNPPRKSHRGGDSGQQRPAAAISATESSMPIGFLQLGTRSNIVDVPRCEIATEAINEQLTRTRAEVKAQQDSYKRGATLLLRDADGEVATAHDTVITETVGDLKLRFLARDFFQNNPFILPAFTTYVREQASQSGAVNLVDAYCGSGLFALSAASAFQQVAGVEISESSIVFAKQNAEANGIGNVRFLASDASAIFEGLEFASDDTAVIIDPPRKGCDEAFLNQLVGYGPRTIVYVSCDPATQMRDLRHLLGTRDEDEARTGYELTAVQPFDLFPQTRHLECVITLQRDI